MTARDLSGTIDDVGPRRPDEHRPDAARAAARSCKLLGAGLLITVTPGSPPWPSGGRRGARRSRVAARVHIGADGTISVMTGKVEEGQGARAELTQAAAEELRVPAGARSGWSWRTPTSCPTTGSPRAAARRPTPCPRCAGAPRPRASCSSELAAERWGVEPGRARRCGTERSPTRRPGSRSPMPSWPSPRSLAEAFARRDPRRRRAHAGRRVEGRWAPPSPARTPATW